MERHRTRGLCIGLLIATTLSWADPTVINVPVRAVPIQDSPAPPDELLDRINSLIGRHSGLLSRFIWSLPSTPKELLEYFGINQIQVTAYEMATPPPEAGQSSPLALIYVENGRPKYLQTDDAFSTALFKPLQTRYESSPSSFLVPAPSYNVTLTVETQAFTFASHQPHSNSVETQLRQWAVHHEYLAHIPHTKDHLSVFNHRYWQTDPTDFWLRELSETPTGRLVFSQINMDGSPVGAVYHGAKTPQDSTNLPAWALGFVPAHCAALLEKIR